MHSFTIVALFSILGGALAAPQAVSSAAIESMPVFTVERVYHTIVDTSPYLVDRTTTIVWTQSPTQTATASDADATA